MTLIKSTFVLLGVILFAQVALADGDPHGAEYGLIASKPIRQGSFSFIMPRTSAKPFQSGTKWGIQFSIPARLLSSPEGGYLVPRNEVWFQATADSKESLEKFMKFQETNSISITTSLSLHEDLFEAKDKSNCIRGLNQDIQYSMHPNFAEVEVKQVAGGEQLLQETKMSRTRCAAFERLLSE